jgi:ACR3 family arsenite transporter
MTDIRAAEGASVVGRLSLLDRFLPVWIFLTMAVGVLAGRYIPQLVGVITSLQVGTVSVPIALGLLWMMYPILTRVRYEDISKIGKAWKVFAVSIIPNWLVGPLVMWALAWLLLPDLPEYRIGLIIVGLARCIAMVLIWNYLAGGDEEVCAIMVALNAVFQVVFYAPMAYFYVTLASSWIAGSSAATVVQVSVAEVARTVLIFLGIPLVLGIITRFSLLRAKGREWFEERLMPRMGPTAMIGLLFTIVVMFAQQGEKIIAMPGDVLRIAIPLLGYFVFMWIFGWLLGWALRFRYPQTVTLAFTGGSNDFELAIAVAVGVFGIASGQALATVVGPLIEVPVLITLVYIALWAKKFFFNADGTVKRALAKPKA